MQKVLYSVTLLIIVSIFSSNLFISEIRANDATIEYESVNPADSFKYGMKRLKEKITLFALSVAPSKKADYYNQIVNFRLAELSYIIDNKDGDSFEVATKRYFSTVGAYTEYIKNKKLDDKKQRAIETFNKHQPILEQLRDTFDPTTAQWRFLEDDINYLKQYKESINS